MPDKALVFLRDATGCEVGTEQLEAHACAQRPFPPSSQGFPTRLFSPERCGIYTLKRRKSQCIGGARQS